MRAFLADIRYAASSLASAKMRTALTMLGVTIGVLSVLTVASIGLSAQQLVVGQVTSLGSDLIAVIPGSEIDESGPPPAAFGILQSTLNRGDELAIAELPYVVAASSYVMGSESVAYRGEGIVTNVVGVSETLPMVESITIAEGSFFGVRDVAATARVAVLGSKVAEVLSPRSSLIGSFITIKQVQYQVVGVLAPRGAVFFQDQDDQVYIPVTTAQRLFAGVEHVNAIRVKAEAPEHMDRVKADIDRLLMRRHRIQVAEKRDFSVRSTDQVLSILGNVTGAMSAFLVTVTGISLAVGGVNIMNIMFVAVRERTREIGLRKALGAKRSRILSQFLVESVLISVLGGVIGIVLGTGLTVLIGIAVTALGYGWETLISLPAMWMSVLLSVGVGVGFGMVPAMKAARLDALESLRYE